MNEKIFNKDHMYTFSYDQIKKILVDLLLLLGENLPLTVLDDEGYEKFSPEIKVFFDSEKEYTEEFDIKLLFTDEDLDGYREACRDISDDGKKLLVKHNNIVSVTEADQELPDNVWTQETPNTCGKE